MGLEYVGKILITLAYIGMFFLGIIAVTAVGLSGWGIYELVRWVF